MDYARPGRADLLAAQYVAGTLRGPARRRFERLLPSHPVLRDAVRRWEDRIVPMALGVPSATPPARVWAAIEARLFGRVAEGRGRADGRGAWLWKGLAGMATCIAIGLAVVALRPTPGAAPIVVVLAPEPTAGNRAGPQLVASFTPDGGPLVVHPLLPVSVSPGRSLQLWAIPRQGQPRSLGLIAATAPTLLASDRVGRDVTALAVSVEPAGGSPTGAPTGPVILSGAL